jgi:outer membrane protein assembly factor BamD (BamD/ComL family)
MFMGKRFAFIALAILVAAATLSCKPDAQCEAEQLLESASRLFAEKQYNKALWKIDSLRKVYPTAIEVRKKALKLH